MAAVEKNMYCRGIDCMTTKIAMVARWLAYVIVALLVFEVVSRRVFSAPTEWNFFITKQIFGVYFLLLAPYGLLQNTNIRIDILYANWSKRTQALVDFLGLLLVFMPLSALIFIYGTNYALDSIRIREATPSSLQLPVYWLKALFIVAWGFLTLQAISEIQKLYQVIRKGEKK